MLAVMDHACFFLVVAGLLYLVCRFAVWVGQDEADVTREEQLRRLRITAEQVRRLTDDNLLDAPAAGEVLAAIERRRELLLGRRPVPVPTSEAIDHLPEAVPVE